MSGFIGVRAVLHLCDGLAHFTRRRRFYCGIPRAGSLGSFWNLVLSPTYRFLNQPSLRVLGKGRRERLLGIGRKTIRA